MVNINDVVDVLHAHEWDPEKQICRCYAWHPYGEVLDSFDKWRNHILNLPDLAS